MPFEMYGDVILTRDVTERGLRAGDVGTVVERHAVAGVTEESYSVEFIDMTGNTVAVVTLPASILRLPTPADRPAVQRAARKEAFACVSALWKMDLAREHNESHFARAQVVWGVLSLLEDI
jgi:hypothetical protein